MSSAGPPNCTIAAVGQHHFDAEHVVDRDAVLERVRPAGVGRHVAADRAGPLARRIGGVVIAGALEGVGEPDVDHARLDDGVAVAEVDLEDLLHPREHDHHAAADRQAAAGQARARPARQERHVVLVADLHDRGHVARSCAETRPRPGSSSRSRSRRTRRRAGRSRAARTFSVADRAGGGRRGSGWGGRGHTGGAIGEEAGTGDSTPAYRRHACPSIGPQACNHPTARCWKQGCPRGANQGNRPTLRTGLR